jgi:thioredoxin 1
MTSRSHPTPVTLATFDAFVGRGVVVLDFSATWCPPCRTFEPVFAAAAARRPELAFGTINTDDEPALAVKLDIRAQPTICVLRDGALVYKQVGAMSAKKLDELLDRFTTPSA